MSLLRNILFNRFSQITCLVIPKHPAALGRRHVANTSDVNTTETETPENPNEAEAGLDESPDVDEISYDGLTEEEMLVPGVYFPTIDVFETSYNGVKYEDLAVVKMIFTRNNVKMGAYTGDGTTCYGVHSCGQMGFKHSQKRSSVAAQTTGQALGEDMARKKIKHCRVEMKGVTMSRLPAMMGLQQAGVNIVSISDRTNHSFYTRPRHAKKL